MNIFEGVELNTIKFIGPIIVLAVTMFLTTFIFKLLFGWLPKRLFNLLIGPVAIIGAYIWAVPMDLGFYQIFK